MMSKAKAARLPMDDAALPVWPSPVTTEPKPDRKLPIAVRLVEAVDRRHYSVPVMDAWTNPPPTCPIETETDERSAEKVGDISVASLPLEQRRKVVALLETAQATADKREMTLEGATRDHLAYLFQSRLPLITDDETLKTAGRVTVTIVERAISNARHQHFPTLEPVFLGQALSQLPGLFPLTN
jgi:hypothetical protein